MSKNICFLVAIFAAFSLISCSSAKKNRWTQVGSPTKGTSESIGGYNAGCLNGAVSLLPDGPGYQVMRISRKRFYGHPSLVNWIERVGRGVERRNLGLLLIGDLSQARGGPSGAVHASHQNGLDVDIWFYHPDPKNRFRLDDRENLGAVSVVTPDRSTVDPQKWTKRHRKILSFITQQDLVDRVFVAPAIKKDMCEKYRGEKWLSRLRAWWGHDDHMHVRLKCPEGSKGCLAQETVNDEDTCSKDLDWWFSEEAVKEAKDRDRVEVKVEPKELPIECQKLLEF